MLKNYFTIAWRNLIKKKAHSFINIAGLSVGMAVAMLIGIWIYDELTFDKDLPKHDRVAQVIQNVTHTGEVQTWTNVPYPLAEELRKNYGSDFKYVVLSTWNGEHLLTFDEKKLNKKGLYAEPQITELLSLKMLNGGKDGLKDPSSILLSESVAHAYFGNSDPLGKVMKIDNSMQVKVAGVFRDMPYNSSFAEMGFIASWELFSRQPWVKEMQDPWRPNSFIVYVQLTENADIAKVSARIKDAKLKKVNKALAAHKPELFLYPMDQWHLYSEFKNGVNVGGRIQYVWLFGIIGVFVLLLACINFMNLSTARSEKRAKEVGIRKAIGSLRGQLILQFFSESLLIAVLAFIFGLILVQCSLPFFNQLADKKISILWANSLFWLSGIGFVLITGLIAGSYPAFYLSSFRPVKVLKGTFKAGRLAAIPRRMLVVLQFTVSIILVIGTIIIFRQIQFARNRPVGYTRDGLISLSMATEDIHKHFDVVKAELLKTGAVSNMAESGASTTGISSSSSGFDWKGKDPTLAVDFPVSSVSYDYGKTVGWQFKEGRDFSKAFASDTSAFILNEAAVKYMGLKDPVGEIVKWDGQPSKVIGVVKNMVMESPYDEIRPTIFNLSNYPNNVIILKLNPAMRAADALGKIEPVFRKYNPSQPFEYQFVDEEYDKKFGNERRIGKLASFFTTLAIFISCLGLFGMASFMAEQRVKEIGVRKVLGASVFNLWGLLSKEFIVLVAASLLIAAPIAYYFMHSWLQSYQYRSDISWWVFAAAGAGALIITILTVSFQSIKAALMNPVKSLRTE